MNFSFQYVTLRHYTHPTSCAHSLVINTIQSTRQYFGLLKMIIATNRKRHVNPQVKILWTDNLILRKETAYVGTATRLGALGSRKDACNAIRSRKVLRSAKPIKFSHRFLSNIAEAETGIQIPRCIAYFSTLPQKFCPSAALQRYKTPALMQTFRR